MQVYDNLVDLEPVVRHHILRTYSMHDISSALEHAAREKIRKEFSFHPRFDFVGAAEVAWGVDVKGIWETSGRKRKRDE